MGTRAWKVVKTLKLAAPDWIGLANLAQRDRRDSPGENVVEGVVNEGVAPGKYPAALQSGP